MASKGTTGNKVQQSNFSQAPGNTTGQQYVWGNASGPWYIETQRMDISYVRVPNYALATTTLGLSGVSTTYNVQDTHLLCVVDAYVSQASSIDNYTSSGLSQNQTFAVNSVSSDTYGNSYGKLDASNLGPAGQVYTSAMYFHRVQLSAAENQPWYNPANYGVSSIHGTNFVLAGGHNTINEVDTSSPQDAVMWDFKKSVQANKAGSLLFGPYTNAQGTGSTQPQEFPDNMNIVDEPVYVMMGTFDPKQETYFQIAQMIDLLGSKVATRGLATTPPVAGPSTGSQLPYYIPLTNSVLMGFNAGILNYDINRHDFTQ